MSIVFSAKDVWFLCLKITKTLKESYLMASKNSKFKIQNSKFKKVSLHSKILV
tara:strand:+ start:286 stop:444 length:159 start_codon:yes stop_codon:yes gene_type:complete